MSEVLNLKWLLTSYKDMLNAIQKIIKDDIMPAAEVYGSWGNFQSKVMDMQTMFSIASKLDITTAGKLFMIMLGLNFIMSSWKNIADLKYDELKNLVDKMSEIISKIDECLAELEKMAPSGRGEAQ